jgi:hypothetical protein
MPAPCTVITAEPVAAWFARPITLSPHVSTDHPCVALPLRSPAVTPKRRVERKMCENRHLTDVSDSQSVDSHPVCPSRPLAVYATRPMFEPCTVTEADPVPPWLPRRPALSLGVSVDHP